MQLFLSNRILQNEWFYDKAFWDAYLTRLARHRYNNLTLTFGHQIAYLSPPYPFLFDVTDFPDIRPIGWTAADCGRHFEIFRYIADQTRLRELHFTVGIWSQHAFSYGEPMVNGLKAKNLSDYNAAGLARLLELCPEVDGVQFRMNYESGVSEENQAEYYAPQFRAIAECDRPIRVTGLLGYRYQKPTE